MNVITGSVHYRLQALDTEENVAFERANHALWNKFAGCGEVFKENHAVGQEIKMFKNHGHLRGIPRKSWDISPKRAHEV